MKFPWIVSILVATISFGLAAVGIATAQDEICPETPLWTHHDGSFEYGYSWQWTMTPPDLGSFAERFTGAGTVCGIQFYLTTTG
ncbi:MAG: hypothetical protein KJ927_09585, partial [Candidatus Eisenbacteria bacterium]|nr:hypothetical protein [Candidatus Eisenbacteria bacterium]